MIIYDSSKEDGTYYNQFRILQHCTVCLPSRCPSPPIAVVFSVHRRCARAVPCRRGAIVCHPLPSRSRRTVHCRRGAIAPSIDTAPHHPSPSSRCPLTSICPLLSRLCCTVHCRPKLSSCHCAVHQHPPSITVDSLLRHPLLSSSPSHCCPPSIPGQSPLHLCC